MSADTVTAESEEAVPWGRRVRPDAVQDFVARQLHRDFLGVQVGVPAPAMAGAGWLWELVRERTWRNRWFGSFAVTPVVTVVLQLLSMMLVKTDAAGAISRGQTTSPW